MKSATLKTLICVATCFLVYPVWAGVKEGIAAVASGDFAKAFAELQPAATSGDAQARWWLGTLYEDGHGVPQDLPKSVYWYRKSAEQGFAIGQHTLGRMYKEGHGVTQDERIAFVWFRKAAEQNYAPAAYELGSAYEHGEGVPADLQQAVAWYRKGADQRHPEAQLALGVMYDAGRGVPSDAVQAVSWYRKAAQQRNMFAQFNLGVMYDTGRGVEKDDQQAAHWFREASEQGLASAQNNLGVMYRDGRGVPKNEQAAVAWYRRAAEQGDANAQYNLGTMFLDQRAPPKTVCDSTGCRLDGLPQGALRDEQQAMVWFRKAAEQGYVQAYVALGVIYGGGLGILKDAQQAVAWYRKAAEQGDADGQFNLGVMYDTGRGVPKDDQLAYFWWLLSAANGNRNAQTNRDIVGATLTAEQRAAAQASARIWKPVTNGSTAEQVPGSVQEAGVAADATGTGFRVNPELIVTNQHVVKDCHRIELSGSGAARVVAIDARNDLALLSTPARASANATIRAGRPQIGEQVVVAGYPLQGLLSGLNVTTGNLSSLAGIEGDTRFVQISAPVQPGNSGGPLLDAAGNVIGVVVSKLNAIKVAKLTGDIPQNVNFAITSNVLRGFLDANGVDYKSGVPGTAITTPEVARRARSFTVLIECWK